MNSIIAYSIFSAVAVGLIAAEIIEIAALSSRSKSCKVRIPMRDMNTLSFTKLVIVMLLLTNVMLALTVIIAFSRYYDFTERTNNILKVANWALISAAYIIRFSVGGRAYLTERGIMERSRFYPRGSAVYGVQMAGDNTYVTVFSDKQKCDFRFLVKNSKEALPLLENLYEKAQGTKPQVPARKYTGRRWALCLFCIAFFPAVLALWYYAAEPVVFVGDKMLPADSEYALFDSGALIVQPEPEETKGQMYQFSRSLKSEDLKSLEKMPNLKYLRLTLNPMEDMSEIGRLTGLRGLYINGYEVNDFTPLENLTELRQLWILNAKGFDGGDFEMFKKMPYLESLVLTNRDLSYSELEAIGEIKGLNILILKGCTIAGEGSLANLTGLKYLSLSDTDITSLDFLENLTELYELEVDGTDGIADYSSIGSCKKLGKLWIAGTAIGDLSFLSELSDLEELSLNGSEIASLAPLEGNDSIKKLYISGIKGGITDEDFSVLLTMPSLEYVSLHSVSNTAIPYEVKEKLKEKGVDVSR